MTPKTLTQTPRRPRPPTACFTHESGRSYLLRRETHIGNAGFSLIELLVVISIILLLASLALPNLRHALEKGELTKVMSNAQQLYMATQSAAMDSLSAEEEASEGWPGDATAPSFSQWIKSLQETGGLSPHEINRLCSAPGVKLTGNQLPTSAEQTAFRIYPISEQSSGEEIFLITRNATIHGSGDGIYITLDKKKKPFGDQGCVLIHRNGEPAIILPSQLHNATLIGTLPPGNQL